MSCEFRVTHVKDLTNCIFVYTLRVSPSGRLALDGATKMFALGCRVLNSMSS